MYNEGVVETVSMFTRLMTTPLLFITKFLVKSLVYKGRPHSYHQDPADSACDVETGAAPVPDETPGGFVEAIDEHADENAIEET